MATALAGREELKLVAAPPSFRRGELNMEIDTLSERSEEEGEEKERKPQRSRRPSGRKRSMSRYSRQDFGFLISILYYKLSNLFCFVC